MLLCATGAKSFIARFLMLTVNGGIFYHELFYYIFSQHVITGLMLYFLFKMKQVMADWQQPEKFKVA